MHFCCDFTQLFYTLLRGRMRRKQIGHAADSGKRIDDEKTAGRRLCIGDDTMMGIVIELLECAGKSQRLPADPCA